MSGQTANTQYLYELIAELHRSSYPIDLSRLPHNGIYLFFEQDEYIEVRGERAERIVRVGTHRKDGRFRQRIRQHYGRVKSELGNKNGSIFRKHVGGALLKRADADHPGLPNWFHSRTKGSEHHEIEVSRTLRNRFTFVSISVPDAEDRLELESGLIALLAQQPLGTPSSDWLGYYARSNAIGASGLWNTQRIDAKPLSHTQMVKLAELVAGSRRE